MTVKFEDARPGQDSLGQICFDAKEVIIFKEANIHRMRFTLAHELGHYFLRHGQFLMRESVRESDFLIGETAGYSQTIRRLEIQANSFAASFLMPKTAFFDETNRVRQALGLKDKGFGLLYVDSQPCNQGHLRSMLTHLSQRFDVSRTACELRLRTLDLIRYGAGSVENNHSSEPRLSSLIGRFFSSEAEE